MLDVAAQVSARLPATDALRLAHDLRDFRELGATATSGHETSVVPFFILQRTLFKLRASLPVKVRRRQRTDFEDRPS